MNGKEHTTKAQRPNKLQVFIANRIAESKAKYASIEEKPTPVRTGSKDQRMKERRRAHTNKYADSYDSDN